ncbi:MAG: hypothetical protein IPK64_12075 [bacterium]|nr:hypothetical protein [bacterium]
MKKLALVLALTMVAFAGTASASDWFADNIGIYFDEAGTNNCDNAPPLTPIPAYLVVTQLNSPDILAWEIALLHDNVTQLSFVPRGNAIDVGINPGEHIVGLPAALPAPGGVCVIADMQLMVMNTNPAGIRANGTFFHSLPIKVPAYLGSATEIRELHPISPAGQPIIVINGDCVVGVEVDTFGGVKSLFR